MTISISFGGATIKRPGAFSTVNTQSMTPITLGALKVLAVIGTAGTGGTLVPGTVAYFNDDTIAAAAVGAGDTLEVMRVAWRHGADLVAVVLADITGPATAPTDAQWQTAIDLLNGEFVNGIIPVTTTATVLAKVDTHVVAQSATGAKRRRRAFYGHAAGLAASAVAALSVPFVASERAVFASPAPKVNGASVPGYYMAAAFAGLWASKAPQDPITFDLVKFEGLDRVYQPSEITTLLDAHIAPVEFVKNEGLRIVQGVTTSTSVDLSQAELSVSTLKDDMSEEIERFFEKKYVGQAGLVGVEVTIYNDFVSILEQFIKRGWILSYVQESVKVTKNGTVFALDWEGKPTLPINNFLLTSRFKL